MFVQNHHSLEELQRLTKALAGKKRIWLRHQAVVLAKQGQTAAIARALGCSHPRPFRPQSTATTRGASPPSGRRPHTGRPPRLARGRCAAIPRPP